MGRGPKNLRVTFDAEALTHYGGALLVHQFLQRIALRTHLWRSVRFPQRNNRYHISETLLAILYPIILGMERLETTESLKHNGVFQYLTGLPGYPDPTSLRRFLKRFAEAGRSGFLKLHERYQQGMLASLRHEPVLDLDASVLTVYGQQERSKVGYTPRKRGRPSYLAVLCFEGRTRDCLEGSLHPGNTHVLQVIRPMVEQALRKLPKPKRLRMRADAAFCDGAFIQWVEERRIQYAIPVRVTRPIQYRLGGLRYRRIRQEVWAAEFSFRPQAWDQARRFVVIRRPVPEEPSAQLHLFQMKGFVYQVLVTNMTATPWHIWQFYNDRSQAELLIRELKAAYALDKIPMHDFAGNEAFFQLVLLAYNLLNWCASRLMRTRSVGVSPTEGHTRPLVAWAAERRETDVSEACRQSHLWDGERATRPQRKRTRGGLEMRDPEAEPSPVWRRQHGDGISGRRTVLAPAG